MALELFKWYKRPSRLGGNYFFIYRMRSQWNYDLIKFGPSFVWSKENLGFIYTEPYHKIDISERSLERLVKGIFEWKWFR